MSQTLKYHSQRKGHESVDELTFRRIGKHALSNREGSSYGFAFDGVQGSTGQCSDVTISGLKIQQINMSSVQADTYTCFSLIGVSSFQAAPMRLSVGNTYMNICNFPDKL